MLRKIYEKIVNNEDLKSSVAELKSIIREDAKSDTHNREAFMYMVGGDYSVITELIKNEDAKIRKNAAIILGELGRDEFLMPLYEAYDTEEMRFVRPAYLEAIANLDFRPVLEGIKEHIAILLGTEINDDNRKHTGEELRLLNNLVSMLEGRVKHTYTERKNNVPLTVVLLTNRNHIHVTSEQLEGVQFKEFGAGVMVRTKYPSELYNIRTYSELLFMCDKVKTVPADEEAAADALTEGSLIKLIEKMHEEEAPFHFRLEVKSKAEPDKRMRFMKRLSAAIALKSNGKLINSTDNYEVELRLVENKEGCYNVLIKFYTLEDERFAYRKNVVAASIKPVNAALCAMLTKDYLKKDAQVLDPFCGTGAMLIERHKAVAAGDMYALDTFGVAVDGAKKNAAAAKVHANFINRDFFDFRHEYLFDEIFTDMPFNQSNGAKQDIEGIYRRFFKKADGHLTQDGIIVMYSHDRAFVKKYAPVGGFKIVKEFEISMKEGTYLYVLAR